MSQFYAFFSSFISFFALSDERLMEIFSQGEADSEELWAISILRGFQTSFFFFKDTVVIVVFESG